METNHLDPLLIKTIPLMLYKEKLKCRKVKAILRYHLPNTNRNAEEYAHYLLFSFNPFRHEGELKYPPISRTYLLKLQQPGVLDVVNRNRHIMKLYCDIVDDALVNLCENIRNIGDSFSQQENDEVDNELIETFQNMFQRDDPAQDAMVLQDEYQGQSVGPIVIPDEELNFKIKMLNQKQRDLFDIVHNWSKRSVKICHQYHKVLLIHSASF